MRLTYDHFLTRLYVQAIQYTALGANLETGGEALAFTVHAEQSAINNALLHGEKSIKRIAVTAAPCGHCRQFLNELQSAAGMEIVVHGQQPTTLDKLLPHSFGPPDLGLKNALLARQGQKATELLEHKDKGICQAAVAVEHSYAPYSGSPSAVVLIVGDNRYTGVYIENAAFNPGLPPVMSALDRLRFSEPDLKRIDAAILVESREGKISQTKYSQSVLEAVAPGVQLHTVAFSRPE